MLTDDQRKAAKDALKVWAAPQIATASIFERAAISAYLEQHGDEMIEIIGGAILAVALPPA